MFLGPLSTQFLDPRLSLENLLHVRTTYMQDLLFVMTAGRILQSIRFLHSFILKGNSKNIDQTKLDVESNFLFLESTVRILRQALPPRTIME